MKVLLVNGSGHVEGCTYTALEEVAAAPGDERDHGGQNRRRDEQRPAQRPFLFAARAAAVHGIV